MIYKINKQSLIEEFGNLDYRPRSLDDKGFVMSAIKNRINHGRPEYKNEPIGPVYGEPSKIPGQYDKQFDQHIVNRSHPLDQHNIHNSDHISSLGH